VPALATPWLGWMMLCALASSNPADSPAWFPEADRFPATALPRRLEPGLSFSVTPAENAAEDLNQRWEVSSEGPESERVIRAIDPVSGLTVVQRRRWLAEPAVMLIDTTVTNHAAMTRSLTRLSAGDWTFNLDDSQDQGYRTLTYSSDLWYGSTYWTGPDWTRVGQNWHHPGTHTPSVRRFTAPRDGRVTITGRIYKLHTDPSDGVRLSVRHRDQEVWGAEIDGDDSHGVDPVLELDVRQGDAIRFVVHKRGDIYCDTTHWDPRIAYADGEAFQASLQFSTTEQGLDGWSYEMETEDRVSADTPRLITFGLDFVPRRSDLAPGNSVALTDHDRLPMWVLSDGEDLSGVVFAVLGQDAWSLAAAFSNDRRLHLQLGPPSGPLTLRPGESHSLPTLVFGPYAGTWQAGMSKIQRLIRSGESGDAFSERLTTAMRRGTGLPEGEVPELDLWLMIQEAWFLEDKLSETVESYGEATRRHLAGTLHVLDDLRAEHGAGFLANEADELDRLATQAGRTDLNPDDWRTLYQRARWLKRHVILANPLMDFGPLLFCKRVPTSYSHLVMQYFGWRARPGGGLFILERPGHSLACRDLLDGRLERGNVLEPKLSYDARRIVFSYVECEGKHFEYAALCNEIDEGFYHIYEVNVDGTQLRQLTDGPFEDLMPTYLPDGGIAFCSTRRRGYARCFGAQFSRRWHVYTLHRMNGDGTNIQTLSFHDTNEWFPTVSHTGHILYARWDYIDRDAVTHQNLWATRPDGTSPVAVWGNATPTPHCTFQAQPVPHSNQIVFTASAHHSVTAGSIALLDPTVAENGQAAITRLTPEVPFPESESMDIREYYAAPWPLSEKYFLVSYSPRPLVWEPGANESNALGIYLLDAFGNRELIYRDPNIGSTNPTPLRPRPTPPILGGVTAPSEHASTTGEMFLADVYEGLGDVPRGSIKELRVVQIFPKTTHVADNPPVGIAREENARAILGTVPVEPDGSARFLLPAHKPVLFQALDEDGFAYQTMRTITYVHPGEKISCVGCHEPRRTTPPSHFANAAALLRAPSSIEPGALGGRPFSFVEVVQPVLDQHCVDCHGEHEPAGGIDLTGTPHQAFTRSYWALCGDIDFWHLGTNEENAAKAWVPRFGARNQVRITPPGGSYGARGSRLITLLRNGHHDVELNADELRRLAAWIDLNAIFYGVNLPEDQARQLRGERLPMPDIQ
jgi:hypothetical protein